jgi:hypothetical protein
MQMIDSTGHDVARAALNRKDALAATRRTPSCSGLNEVCGLTAAKQFLYQAVVMPSKLPHLFQGIKIIDELYKNPIHFYSYYIPCIF